MSVRGREEMVDELSKLARASEPPVISSDVRDRMIERALTAAERPVPVQRGSRWGWAVAAVAVAACATMVLAPRASTPNAWTLASGDRVYAREGAEIAIVSDDALRRSLRLVEGEALFDVRPLGPTGAFDVTTDELTVHVRGTVFVVERHARTTVVRVHEGHVEVRDGEATVMLEAGEAYTSGTARTHDVDEGALAALGRTVAEARAAEARATQARATRAEVPRTEPVARIEEPAVTEEVYEPAEVVREEAARRTPRSAPDVSETRAEPSTQAPSEDEALAAIEQQLAHREFETALRDARLRTGWRARVLEGHALIGLARTEEGARIYEEVARSGPPSMRNELAYRAASVRFRAAHDPRGALVALSLGAFANDPLEERAMGLRALSLDAAGDHAAASSAASDYVSRYPEGGLSEEVRALVR